MRPPIRCVVQTLWLSLIAATGTFAFADGPAAHTETDAAAGARPKQRALAPLAGVVVDAGGKPVQGAKVAYWWWANSQGQEIETTCDEQGRFTLPPSPEWNGRGAWPAGVLWAGAAGYRLRYQWLFEEGKPSNSENVRLQLSAPAGVSIAVRGPDGKPLPGAEVSATTVRFEKTGALSVPAVLRPLAQATTDERGIARLLALDRDELYQVDASTPEHGTQSRFFGQGVPGEEQDITISLRPTGRVTGRFIAPRADLVRGITIGFSSMRAEPTQADQTMGFAGTVSDDQGRFEVPALAEGVIRHISVQQKPDQAFLPMLPSDVELAAGGTARLEIPLRPAVRVRGSVRYKASGKPVAGAMIGVFDDNGSSSAPASTGEDGRFDMLRLPGQLRMYLSWASSDGNVSWFNQRFVQVPGGVEEFELPPIELALAKGRVVDGAGRGLAGAKIVKVVTRLDLDGQIIEDSVLSLSGPKTHTTDANGEYQAWVESGRTYRVQIQVEGQAPRWTEWADFSGDGPALFSDLVIDPLRSIAGRVADRQGKPVAGATVIQSGDGPQRTEVVSDGDGRFRLDGYQNDSGYVFASAEGFRFHGQRIKGGHGDVTIVLTKTSEPPVRRLKTLPETDAAADAELAKRILAPLIDRKAKGPNYADQILYLRQLALVDPAEALDRVETSGLKGGGAGMIRMAVAKQWAMEHADDAAAIIESLDAAYSRAAGYSEVVNAIPGLPRDRKIEWLGKARFHLRGADDPTMRAALGSFIAKLLLESGDRDAAEKLIGELKPDVDALAVDGFADYARGVAAEALAGIDLPAALALIKDLKDDSEYDRHHGNIARVVAASNPTESLRVLRMVRDQFQRDQHAARVAYALAPVDAARASEAIGLIADPEQKAAAEVLAALALSNAIVERNSFRSLKAENKPKRKNGNGMNSVLQLERAYEALARLSASDARHAWGYHAAPVWAAWLLPAVETIEPDRLDEFVWRALSLRVPLLKQGQREQTAVLTRAYLAMFLARYDRPLARELYGDLIQEASAHLDEQEFAGAAKGLFAAAAAIDASWCAEQYQKLPDRAKNAARGGMVGILSQSGEARWRAESDLLRMWMPWNSIE